MTSESSAFFANNNNNKNNSTIAMLLHLMHNLWLSWAVLAAFVYVVMIMMSVTLFFECGFLQFVSSFLLSFYCFFLSYYLFLYVLLMLFICFVFSIYFFISVYFDSPWSHLYYIKSHDGAPALGVCFSFINKKIKKCIIIYLLTLVSVLVHDFPSAMWKHFDSTPDYLHNLSVLLWLLLFHYVILSNLMAVAYLI